MDYAIENKRLQELVLVVRANKPFFDEFVQDLNKLGYTSVSAFVREEAGDRAATALTYILQREPAAPLLDGLGRAYSPEVANWYFLSWLLRDAPAQRLGPMVRSMPGASVTDRRAALLNRIRLSVAELFPDEGSWEWPAVSEVMLDRLEGSRRALKGTLFEGIVRRVLEEYIASVGLPLTVTAREVRLFEETYDVEVKGLGGSILFPVKTRETMGGGHALLFTRDIDKSISVAEREGYKCVPVVIAESWGGNLAALGTEFLIHLQLNPNQLTAIEPLLRSEVERLLPLLQGVAVKV
ncbi:MAG: hypothetical protein ACYDAK_13990 [Candidatus Limnocylindrales bacterium]